MLTRLFLALGLTLAPQVFAASPETLLNKPAPEFELKNQDGKIIKLADRKAKGWTVLFFYPKAGTPGCTTQACAFRDSIKVIQKLNTVVYGVSADNVADQKKFHDEHKLSFDLLADEQKLVNGLFLVEVNDKGGAKSMFKRTTFIIDPQLVVKRVLENVDPALDAKNVAKMIEDMQKKS